MSTTDTERKTILLVDDNATNLTIGKGILKEHYKVYPVPSAEIMFDLLENLAPDLVLLDIKMPEMNGYEAIRLLKQDPKLAEIPVIFLTSKSDEESELEGLSLGAIDYIGKPFSGPLLIKRIENHLRAEQQRKQLKDYNENLKDMVQDKTEQIYKLQNSVFDTVADLVEFRDGNTGGHISRTQKYLELLIDEMLIEGIYADEASAWDLSVMVPSARLHDVGKIAISDTILNKPGKLTDEEFEVMKTHVKAGVEIIRHIAENAGDSAFLHHGLLIAKGHHEKWDGSGYPAGAHEAEIPLEGRLMAIADVYDALISARPYKKPMSTDTAQKIIEEGKGTHFDPLLVDVFSNIANRFAQTAHDSVFMG